MFFLSNLISELFWSHSIYTTPYSVSSIDALSLLRELWKSCNKKECYDLKVNLGSGSNIKKVFGVFHKSLFLDMESEMDLIIYFVFMTKKGAFAVYTLQKKEVWDQLFCPTKCFKIRYIYRKRKPTYFFSFFILCYFIFSPNRPLCRHRPGHS